MPVTSLQRSKKGKQEYVVIDSVFNIQSIFFVKTQTQPQLNLIQPKLGLKRKLLWSTHHKLNVTNISAVTDLLFTKL